MPTALRALNGGYLGGHRDRERAQPDESAYEDGLGDFPGTDASDRERWEELVASVPAGVLKRSDRIAAQVLCRLWSRFRRNELSKTEQRQLISLLSKFGLTPADRAKPREPGAVSHQGRA